jgi:hypothetical protein
MCPITPATLSGSFRLSPESIDLSAHRPRLLDSDDLLVHAMVARSILRSVILGADVRVPPKAIGRQDAVSGSRGPAGLITTRRH